MNEPCRIQLLGGLSVKLGDHTLTRFRSRKTAELLAYLAYFRHRQHSREVLIELFWPEAELEAGRHSLSVSLSSLRQQLEPEGTRPEGEVLITDRHTAGLNPLIVTTDVAEFESALKSAAQAGDPHRRKAFLGNA